MIFLTVSIKQILSEYEKKANSNEKNHLNFSEEIELAEFKANNQQLSVI